MKNDDDDELESSFDAFTETKRGRMYENTTLPMMMMLPPPPLSFPPPTSKCNDDDNNEDGNTDHDVVDCQNRNYYDVPKQRETVVVSFSNNVSSKRNDDNDDSNDRNYEEYDVPSLHHHPHSHRRFKNNAIESKLNDDDDLFARNSICSVILNV